VFEKKSNNRIVHKFELILTDEKVEDFQVENNELPDDNRIIPGMFKLKLIKETKLMC
jgi:hypothetical protein